MAHDPEAFAAMVVSTVKAGLVPVLERLSATEALARAAVERLSAAEARLAMLGDVRDRMVAVETKSAAPSQPDADFYALRDRVTALETTQAIPSASEILLGDVKARLNDLGRLYADIFTQELSALRERVAVVEARPPAPGPKGEPGDSGKDGSPGLSFEGVYQEGQAYEKGNLVTWAGSSWHCNTQTTTKPGDGSKDWTLMVKRGRDGKDGINGMDRVPVVTLGSRA